MFEMPWRPFGFFQYEAEIHLDRSYCEEVSALHGDSKGATGLALKNGKKNATNSGWSKLIGFKFGQCEVSTEKSMEARQSHMPATTSAL